MKEKKVELLEQDEMKARIWEPKTNNRFIVEFPHFSSYLMCGITLPSFSIKKDEILWKPITLKLYDTISANLDNEIMRMVKLQDGQKKWEDMTITTLDPCGAKISKWTLQDLEISEVSFGNLSFMEGDVVTIEIVFNYSKAEFSEY